MKICYITATGMGKALCNFMSVTDGKLTISDPGVAIDDMEYIATVLI